MIREEFKRPIQKLGEKHERPLQIKEELREALEMLKQEQLREEQEKQRLEQLKEEEKEAEKQKLDLRLKIDHNVSAMTCSIPHNDAESFLFSSISWSQDPFPNGGSCRRQVLLVRGKIAASKRSSLSSLLVYFGASQLL